jgi:hypothetical protein
MKKHESSKSKDRLNTSTLIPSKNKPRKNWDAVQKENINLISKRNSVNIAKTDQLFSYSKKRKNEAKSETEQISKKQIYDDIETIYDSYSSNQIWKTKFEKLITFQTNSAFPEPKTAESYSLLENEKFWILWIEYKNPENFDTLLEIFNNALERLNSVNYIKNFYLKTIKSVSKVILLPYLEMRGIAFTAEDLEMNSFYFSLLSNFADFLLNTTSRLDCSERRPKLDRKQLLTNTFEISIGGSCDKNNAFTISNAESFNINEKQLSIVEESRPIIIQQLLKEELMLNSVSMDTPVNEVVEDFSNDLNIIEGNRIEESGEKEQTPKFDCQRETKPASKFNYEIQLEIYQNTTNDTVSINEINISAVSNVVENNLMCDNNATLKSIEDEVGEDDDPDSAIKVNLNRYSTYSDAKSLQSRYSGVNEEFPEMLEYSNRKLIGKKESLN